MQKSSINPAILEELFSSAANAADKGQSQFFTPLEFGRQLAAGLPKFRGTLVDLTCGNGALLAACAAPPPDTARRHPHELPIVSQFLGADIDPCRSLDGLHVARITKDLTLLYPLLKETRFAADLFVLNSPWGLEWHRDRLKDLSASALPAVRAAFQAINSPTIDSSLATLLIALDLCTDGGEGLLISNQATLDRLIFKPGAPCAAIAQHIWLNLVIPGNPMTGEDTCKWVKDEEFKTGVIYFARGHRNGPTTVRLLDANIASHNLSLQTLRLKRQGAQLYPHLACEKTSRIWDAVKEQVNLLAKPKPTWNLWLAGNVVQVHLSRFEELSTKVDKAECARLAALQGKNPMQLVLQRNERQELVHVAREAGWRVSPELLAAIDDAIAQYHGARAPLYPLSKIMRLGYLDEEDSIMCEHDLGNGVMESGSDGKKPKAQSLQHSNTPILFKAGQSYPISTKTVNTERHGKKENAVTGMEEDVTYTGQELAIFLTGEDGEDIAFLDSRVLQEGIAINGIPKDMPRLTLQQLADNFVIPEVPDVAALEPEAYEKNLATLTGLEQQFQIKFKDFQKQDLARSALHDGFILGWDTGLGKTWALYLWPLLKLGSDSLIPGHSDGSLVPNGPVLIVAPGDLHDQIMKEAREKFNLRTTRLDSQAKFNLLTRQAGSPLTRLDAQGRPILPNGYYLTSYTELTTNGVAGLPDVDKWKPRALLEYLGLKVGTQHSSLWNSGGELPELESVPGFGPKDPAVIQWPETVVGFFDYRGGTELWGEEYDAFNLDCRYAVQAELERSYNHQIAELANWDDDKAAQNRRNYLNRAREILDHLIPHSITPSLHRSVSLSCLTAPQQDWVIKEFCRRRLEMYEQGLGKIKDYPIGPIPPGYDSRKPETDTRLKWRIKCIASPSLSDLCYDAFRCVGVDEGVRLKSEDTIVGQGVRQLTPEYRLIATATPIKNRLGDIFRLVWWAAGGKAQAHARFPYRDDTTERSSFEKTFMIGAEIQGYTEDGKRKPARKKVTAEVCNIHRLWKLLGPLVVRRRMENCGEEIVPCVRKVFRCHLGTEQRRVMKYHIDASYVDRNGLPAIGAQLQALRQAAAAPATDHLLPQLGSPSEPCPDCADTPYDAKKPKCPRCAGAGSLPLPPRSTTNYTPKIATVLSLIQEITARGEQVIVGSAFREPNHELSRRLRDAGVRHCLLDGDTSPKRRAQLAAIFKAGPQFGPSFSSSSLFSDFPVALAGVDAVAEGHSFNLCNNVILYCYSWAYDKFKQFLARVRRLTSLKQVNVYVVLCDGTIDGRLESLVHEKSDSSDLVLDGTLMGDRPEEVNFAELLRLAASEFNGAEQTVDESRLEAEWSALRRQLESAQLAWDARIPASSKAAPLLVFTPPPARPVFTVLPESGKKPVTALRSDPFAEAAEVPTPAPSTINSPNITPSWADRFRERASRLACLQAA